MYCSREYFKTSRFLPLDFKTGRPSEDSHPTVGQYLPRDQTRHIQKGRNRGIYKCRYDITGGRMRETIEQTG